MCMKEYLGKEVKVKIDRQMGGEAPKTRIYISSKLWVCAGDGIGRWGRARRIRSGGV